MMDRPTVSRYLTSARGPEKGDLEITSIEANVVIGKAKLVKEREVLFVG